MPGVSSVPPRSGAAGSTGAHRVRFHLARWAPLVLTAIVTRLCFPPAGVPAEPVPGFGQSFLGPLLYHGMILSLFWLLLLFYRRETYVRLREMAFFGGLFSFVVALAAVLVRLFPDRPEFLPIPFAAILVSLLYNGRIALFAAVTLAILLGGGWGVREDPTLFFGLAGGVAAALSMRVVRRRSQVYVTIAAITAAEALAAVALGLSYDWPPGAVARSVLAAAVTALGSASVALVVLPLAESVTRITTDLTLLELSDPSRPLLQRLSLEAPGTWAHSLVMATLSESACNAIGANGLLARVGCYYHDIGKLKNPGYFVENLSAGHNPHDQLAPEHSARMIRAHVQDGFELATAARLPDAIKNFILEHHGTSRLEYFLEQARESDRAVDLEAEEFHYPGPRPRSRETAVAMLADASEAAVRVLDEANPERVREAVDHLVQQRIASDQLREAPLTLKDLDRVVQEFVRQMTGMYHNRLEYPSGSGGITAEFGR